MLLVIVSLVLLSRLVFASVHCTPLCNGSCVFQVAGWVG